jgi:hypothetical protein
MNAADGVLKMPVRNAQNLQELPAILGQDGATLEMPQIIFVTIAIAII